MKFPRLPLVFQSLLVWAMCLSAVALARAAVPAGAQTPIFWRLIIRDDWAALWVLGAVWALALLLAPRISPGAIEALLDFIERRLFWICGASFGVFAALAWGAYGRFPLSMDEYSIVYQSQVFASGHLDGRVPPALLPQIIAPEFVLEFWGVDAARGLIAAAYWPGTALLMTPFSWLGAPWLFNPALSAATLGVFGRAVRDWTGNARAASWATLLLLASPVFAINAASFYAMPAHLLFNLGFSWLLWRALNPAPGARKWALCAGIVGGFALVLHNPIPHFFFALPWWIFLARRRRALILPLLAGYLVFALPLGLGWLWHLKSLDAGRPELALSVLERLPRIFVLPSAQLLLLRAFAAMKIVAWATPGLVALAWAGRKNANAERANAPVAIASDDMTGAKSERANDSWASGAVPIAALLTQSLASELAIYLFISYSQGHGWGYRFGHPAWFVLPFLAALALVRLPDARAWGVAACLCLGIMVPLRAWQAHDLIAAQRAQLPDVDAAPGAASILFVATAHGSYSADLVRDDPFLRDANWRLIARDPASNAALARQILGANARQTKRGAWGELWVTSPR